jgi:hypothetical protein
MLSGRPAWATDEHIFFVDVDVQTSVRITVAVPLGMGTVVNEFVRTGVKWRP